MYIDLSLNAQLWTLQFEHWLIIIQILPTTSFA